MARKPTTPWPTTPGSVFFGDAASDATLSRATKDDRIRRLARGLYSADLRTEPAELVARNRWKIVARLVPDALVADRSAAEGGRPVGGVLTVVSNERKEDLTLPGLVIAPRTGPGPLDDDLGWAEGLRLSSDARTLVDNLAVSRGRGGRPARTLSRAEVEGWVVRTAQRRPDGWLESLRARALEEGEAIVESGEIPDERPEDAHDVLGTLEAVHDPDLRRATPGTVEELFELLGRRHGLVMGGRPDKRPGQFKERSNQAGSYIFVAPALIEGTLVEGFRRIADLPPGFARAAYELFLISEVHPYDDGNGRVARAAMCAQLTDAGLARIVIPIVFRNEYQTALRSLSREGRCDLYARTLAHAWRWTAAMPWRDRAAVDGYLVATNALVDSTDAERTGVRLELP